VLLVEAGGSGRHLNVQIPAAFPKQFKTGRHWEFYTELGGSSGQNAMIYIRGNRLMTSRPAPVRSATPAR